MPNVLLDPGPGEVRVANHPGELHQLSLEGYRLVAIENHEEIQLVQFEELDKNGYRQLLVRSEKLVVTGYVLHRDEASVLAGMARDRKRAEEAAASLGLAASELKEKLDAAIAAHARQGAEVERITQARDFEKKQAVELRDKADKLEGHIGKLRKALGELRMKEILGE